MKNAKLIIASLTLMFTVLTTTANNENNALKINSKNSKKELRTKIISLLGDKVAIEVNDNKTIKANISLLLNNKNELIIVSVNSKNALVDSFVKSKLNYKTIKVNGIKKGEIYKMPLTIKGS